EVDECRATDLQTQSTGIGAGGASGAPRPDVVRAHDVPPAQSAPVAHPGHRRADLLVRRLADAVDAGALLPALVQRGVHVGNASLGDGGDTLPDGGDVPAGQGVDPALVDEGADLPSDVLG